MFFIKMVKTNPSHQLKECEVDACNNGTKNTIAIQEEWVLIVCMLWQSNKAMGEPPNKWRFYSENGVTHSGFLIAMFDYRKPEGIQVGT